MNPVSKIIIVDDHRMFREGLKLLIETEKMGEVIAEAENGEVFLKLLDIFQPDLVLMDIEMPGMGGEEAIVNALVKKPQLKILVLTMYCRKENYEAMLKAGAMGFLMKTSGKLELEKAIRTVILGDSYFSTELLRKIIIGFGNQTSISNHATGKELILSQREMEILHCFCNGLTATEIAYKLCRSIKTIEAHRSKLLQKTNSKNTLNLVLFAIKNRLLEF